MASAPVWIERGSRTPTWLAAHAVLPTGAERPIFVTNVSTGGCRMKSNGGFQVGDVIVIAFQRLGRISAVIRWADGSSAGAEFIEQSDVWDNCANVASR